MNTINSLGIEHYQWAEVRLVICIDEAQNKHRLIFCTVTLHPDFVPKPEPIQDSLLSVGALTKLFFRRVVMQAEQAVTWYARLGDAVHTPVPFETQESEHEYNNITFLCPDLLNEMEWPSLAMPLNKPADLTGFKSFNPAPFISERNSKIHRKFGNTDGLMHILKDEWAIDFIERCAHVNLKNYQEYLASACLVAPNPLIQKVDNFLIQKENTEAVFHRFIARPGKSLDGLKITIHEENNSLLTCVHTQDIPENGIIELNRPKCMGEYGYEVTHERYGLIIRHEPAGFLRQVQISSGIIDKQFAVSAPIGSKKDAKEKTYTSSQVVKVSENIVGAENVPHNFNARVALASELRRLKAFAEESSQKFFSADSREEAIDFIHQIISNAKHKVLIADPYFSHLQDTQFLYAIRNAEVDIEIVTSQLVFSGKKEVRKEKSELLKKSLNRSQKETGRKITAKVLTGKIIILHDRFLVVDNDVWFMGNSLSDIGQRASMILKVPYPKIVIDEILLIQEKAIELDQFIINQND